MLFVSSSFKLVIIYYITDQYSQQQVFSKLKWLQICDHNGKHGMSVCCAVQEVVIGILKTTLLLYPEIIYLVFESDHSCCRNI